MSKQPWDDMDNFSNEIKKDSEKRRKNPLRFFVKFLESIWMDNTEEEALVQWKVKVEHFPWYAMDALFCINSVINNPPDNITDILEENGWIAQYNEKDGEIIPYTIEDSLEWLKQMYNQFLSVFESNNKKY